MKINWEQYWKDNIEWKNKNFPKMRFKKLANIWHCIRLFFRVSFSKKWRETIKNKKPEWVRE